MIEDAARFPGLAYVEGKEPKPTWEKAGPGYYETWTYNSGMVLAALGESYMAACSSSASSVENAAAAKKYLIDNGIDLANAALDRLSWGDGDGD